MTLELGRYLHGAHLSRRAALAATAGVGGLALIGAGVVAEKTLNNSNDNQHAVEIPPGIVDVFRTGKAKTTYGYDSSIPQERRSHITEVITSAYDRLSRFYGIEPNDVRGETGILSVVTVKSEEDTRFQTAFSIPVAGTRRFDVALESDANDFVVRHELAHTFWGAARVQMGEEPYYIPLAESVQDIAAIRSGSALPDYGDVRSIFRLSDIDYSAFNKPKIASDGQFIIGLQGVRRILGAKAIDEIVQTDPNFIPTFRANYLQLWKDRVNTANPPEQKAVRQAFRNSYSGDFDQLVKKHPILTDALPGKHVIISPYFDPVVFQQEIIVAYCAERDSKGLKEKSLPTERVKVSAFINDKLIGTQTLIAPNGACVLDTMPNLQDRIPGQKVAYKVETSFDTDEVSFTVPKAA